MMLAEWLPMPALSAHLSSRTAVLRHRDRSAPPDAPLRRAPEEYRFFGADSTSASPVPNFRYQWCSHDKADFSITLSSARSDSGRCLSPGQGFGSALQNQNRCGQVLRPRQLWRSKRLFGFFVVGCAHGGQSSIFSARSPHWRGAPTENGRWKQPAHRKILPLAVHDIQIEVARFGIERPLHSATHASFAIGVADA
jgi:hypothetical protein